MLKHYRLSKAWIIICGLLAFLAALRFAEYYLAWGIGDRDGKITSLLLAFTFQALYVGLIISIIGMIIDRILLFISHSIPIKTDVCRKFSDHTIILGLILLLVLGNLLIFKEYLFGKHCLIFLDDRGSDSALLTLPTTYFFTNSHPLGDFWMHESVFGNTVFSFPMLANIFDPLLHLVFFKATVTDVAHRMVYYVMLQSFTSGMGIYGFLRRSGRSSTSAVIGAMCYAFCGAFTASATWVPLLLLPLLTGLALILWTFKLWQQGHQWYMFTIAAAYFVVSTQIIVTLYQLAIFLAIYLIYEYLLSGGRLSLSGCRLLAKQGFKAALVGGIGVLGTGIVLFPHFYYMFFENYRYHSPQSFLLRIPSIAIWLRLFSNDLTGTVNNAWTESYGYSNYFEMPFLYAGILFVFVIPAWYLLYGYQTKYLRELKAITILLLPFLFAIVWPEWRSYLFYGGKVAYFRWASVWTVVTFVIVGTKALDLLLIEGYNQKKRIVLSSVAMILIGGLAETHVYLSKIHWNILDQRLLFVIIGSFVGYLFLLRLKNIQISKILLIVSVFIELVWQGHHTVTYQRHPLRKATASETKSFTADIYSYPPMLRALDYVKHREPGQFIRISKTPDTIPHPLANQDNSALYQGYYGTKGYTSFNNRFTLAFFFNRQISKSFLAIALRDRYLLNALVGVKYYLKRGALEVPPWALSLTSFHDVDIFADPRALPLGIVYHDYLWQQEFDALHAEEPVKDAVFMSAAVLADSPDAHKLLQRSHLSHVTAPFPSFVDDAHVRAAIQEKQRTAMTVTTLTNDVITGTIEVKRPGLLFFSIPFDPGWHVLIDGQETQKLLVNIGFLGAMTPAGRHAITLSYRPPYYQTGKMVSCGTGLFLFLAVSVFRTPMRHWLRLS